VSRGESALAEQSLKHMRSAGIVFGGLICSLAFSHAAWSQACTPRAMESVYEAQSKLAAGNAIAAAQLLERAADVCVNSCKVFLAIAETYTKMNNPQIAARYQESAKLLGCSVSPSPAAATNTSETAGKDSVVSVVKDSYVRQKWALVVGIDHFLHPNIPALHLSAKDARDFAAALENPQVGRFLPGTVTLLVNEDATLQRIRSEINRIGKVARPEDLVILYFSSHGSSKDMDTAADKGKTGYIITYDTDVEDLYPTAFSMKELKDVVDSRLNSGRVITFLDTCYSGDTVRGSSKGMEIGLPENEIAKVAQGTGRVVITSSRSNELSWECDVYQNSCFTHQLLEAMRQNNGLSTITDIYKQLQLTVPQVVMREKKARQNPLMQPESGKLNIVMGTPID
jgi:hypothetical protein